MSYDRHQHRTQHHHPYHRDQRSPAQHPGARNEYREFSDRRNYHSPGHRFPQHGEHESHGHRSGPHHPQVQFSGHFRPPVDQRSFQSNGVSPHYAQRHDVSRHHSHNQSLPSPHYPQHNRTPDRNFGRHPTGSYENQQHDFGQRNPRRESEPGPSSSPSDRRSNGPSNDLQSRTLRVTGFDPKVTKELLKELFVQVGPVRNVVLRADHSFVEFQDQDSVAYALAAMDGIHMFGRPLRLEPKIHEPDAFRYLEQLKLFERRPDLFGIEH